MDTFNNKVPSGPQDYVNFYHTNEEGNIYLDGEGKPFSLQRTLTEPAQVISPKDLWDSTQTRHGTHAPYQPRDTKPTIVLPLTQILTHSYTYLQWYPQSRLEMMMMTQVPQKNTIIE